jgi:hypothetical protein
MSIDVLHDPHHLSQTSARDSKAQHEGTEVERADSRQLLPRVKRVEEADEKRGARPRMLGRARAYAPPTATPPEKPKDRSFVKFTWVYKTKRDGTKKARLCVQGCSQIPGVDYDQTFCGAMRAIAAIAAARGYNMRRWDFVAAYLQGELQPNPKPARPQILHRQAHRTIACWRTRDRARSRKLRRDASVHPANCPNRGRP